MFRASLVLRRAAAHDWNALIAKVPQDQKSVIIALKRDYDQLDQKIKTTNDELPKIDWERFMTIIDSKKVVQDVKAYYESFQFPKVDPSAQIKSIDEEGKKAIEAVQEPVKQAHQLIVQLNSQLASLDQIKPLDQLTMEDIAKNYPELIKRAHEDYEKTYSGKEEHGHGHH